MVDVRKTAEMIRRWRIGLVDKHGAEGQSAFVYEGVCADIIGGKYPVTDPFGAELVRWAEKRGLLVE